MQIKAKKCQILQSKIKFGNHGNNKNCVKGYFDAYKEESNKKIIFGKLFRTTVVSMAYQLKLLNLVTMATNKIV